MTFAQRLPLVFLAVALKRLIGDFDGKSEISWGSNARMLPHQAFQPISLKLHV